MPNTAGGPLGGLLRDPALWEKLLNSFSTIGRFLGEDPSKTSVPRNVGRDLTQIGLVAPLGIPGGVGLTSFGEGMRPPWEQSPIQGPLQGLKMTSELAKLAFTQPEMLQKLGTSASLGLPSMISSAFREHPVLTPLMAVPILPGGKRFSRDDLGFGNIWHAKVQELLSKGLSTDEAVNEAIKFMESMKGKWPTKELEGALRRIAARERRIKRKLTQHEVEDVIAQAMSEARPTAPPSQNAPKMWSEQKYAKWSDSDIEERLLQLSTAPPLYKPIIDALRYEQARRAAGGRPYRSREELLHEFEEGPPGPLPPMRVGREGPVPPPLRPTGPVTSAELDYYAQQGNFSRAEHSTQPFEPRVSGVHKLSNKDLLARFKELSSDTHDMLKSNVLPGGIHTFRNLEYLAELEKRGIVPKDFPITADLLRNILKARQGVEGKQPLPPGIFSSPEQIGGQMLRGELGPPGELGLAMPTRETPPSNFMDVIQSALGVHPSWQQRVQQLLENEWSRYDQKQVPDVQFGTNFLNTYAGSQPIGTKFSYKGQDFMRLRRGWSYIPRGEGPQTYGELSKQVTGGSDLLSQVPLPKQPQTWQQGIVQKLTEMDSRVGNTMGHGIYKGEWWENGQRFVKGRKGWMMDPKMFIPPIQHIGGQTILPRPEGALSRYLDRTVWSTFDDRISHKTEVPKTRHFEDALTALTKVTGSPQIAQFWLKQHIFQRITERKATPSEVVWFELQRKMPGINPSGTAKEPFRISPGRLGAIRGLKDYDLTRGYNEMNRVKNSPEFTKYSEYQKADLEATMQAYAQEMKRRRQGPDEGMAGSVR